MKPEERAVEEMQKPGNSAGRFCSSREMASSTKRIAEYTFPMGSEEFWPQSIYPEARTVIVIGLPVPLPIVETAPSI
jgi:epoxyqueuosine reductase QueG